MAAVSPRVLVMSVVHDDDVAVGGAAGEPARELFRTGRAPPVPIPQSEAPTREPVVGTREPVVRLPAAPSSMRPEQPAWPSARERLHAIRLACQLLRERVRRL